MAPLILIFHTLNTQSQQIVVHDTTYRLEYKISKATTSNPYLISFLDKLSEVTNVGDPYFYIDMNVPLTITKGNANQYQVSCVVEKREIRGNNLWNGFDLSPSFFPSQFNAVVEITVNGKTTRHPVSSTLTNKQTLLPPIMVDSALMQPSAKMKEIGIEFDRRWQNEIMQQIAAIDVYLKSDSILASWDSSSKKIDLLKTELIPLYDFEMDDLMNEIKAVTELNIIYRLKLNEKDPKQFGNKLANINIAISQKQVLLNEYLMNIDQRFIMDARKFKEQGNILQSILSYNKALEYHAFNITALLELSKLYYEIGNLQDASLLTKRMLTTTYPSGKQEEEVNNATSRLYRKIVDQGNDMLVAQKFAEAQSIFEKANLFCDSIENASFCDGRHTKGIIAAKTGIYRSYITIVRKALQNNFTEIAENYIKEAHKYQQANQRELPSDAEHQACVNELVNKLLSISNRQLQAKQYVKALVSIEKADSVGHLFRPDFHLPNLTDYRRRAAQGGFDELIAQTNKYALQFDQFMAEKSYEKTISFKKQYGAYIQDTNALKSSIRNIKNIEYLYTVNIGHQLSRQQLNQNALDRYLYAKELEKTYQIPATTNLDSLILLLSKPLTMDYLSKCRQNIWGNDFGKATEWLMKADSMMKNANLFHDTSVVFEVQKTEKLLKSQLCSYQNVRYNNFTDTYNRSLKEKNFTVAASVIDSMTVISSQYPQCVTEIRITQEEKKQILQLSTYQQWIKDARYLIAISQVPQGLATFYKADSLYANSLKWNPKSTYDSLSNIFILINNPKTLTDACSWLYINGKTADAFTLLVMMKQKGVSAREAKTLQKNIAKGLVKTDKETSPSVSKKELLKKYHANGGWFFTFRSAYLGNPINALLP